MFTFTFISVDRNLGCFSGNKQNLIGHEVLEITTCSKTIIKIKLIFTPSGELLYLNWKKELGQKKLIYSDTKLK